MDADDDEVPKELPPKYVASQAEATKKAPPHMKPYAKWSPFPPYSDELIKELQWYGFLEDTPAPRPARQRSASRTRSHSRGRTSVNTDIMVSGLPEDLMLYKGNREYSPPKEKVDKLELETVYHDPPPQPNNFTDAEILACVAHRMRAHHGITTPPESIIYEGERSMYEHWLQEEAEMSDQPSVPATRAYEIYDHIGEEAGLSAPRPDGADALAYFNELRDK